MARLLVSLLVLASATLSACQFHEEAQYINHVSHADLMDFQRKAQLHDDLMNGLQSQASRSTFKDMRVDSKHKDHVKEMLRGEIKPVRRMPALALLRLPVLPLASFLCMGLRSPGPGP